MTDIIPAILTNNITDLESKLKIVDEAVEVNEVKVKRVQIDVIDGEFADNKTVDPSLLVNLETNLSLDFHLMVKEPVKWVEKCATAGADRIIGQIEMMENQVEFVSKVAETGLYVGLAIDLDTPVSKLDPAILNNVDVILVMAVKAGWGGQTFNERVLDKIKSLDEIRIRDATPFKICVDGGETSETIPESRWAGADEVVVGQRLFKGDFTANINMLT